LPDILQAYIEAMATRKTARSVSKDTYYLRDTFGKACPALEALGTRKPPRKRFHTDARKAESVIEATHIEDITTAEVSAFISSQVARRGLAPKSANRYREILHRVIQWAMDERGIRLPGSVNPVGKVKRYKERTPVIRYLTLPQIDKQLHALRFKPQLQAMVATLIYAGLRREELLWLTPGDVSLPRAGSPRPAMMRVQAKTIDGESWQPKTAVNRAVPISQALRPYLERYASANDSTWLFPSPHGKRWDGDNFSADLRAANADAGLAWSCLDYRHTFGSSLAQSNISLYKISQLMGNSPQICSRHYASLLSEAMILDIDTAFESRNEAIEPASRDY
jgi:integrase